MRERTESLSPRRPAQILRSSQVGARSGDNNDTGTLGDGNDYTGTRAGLRGPRGPRGWAPAAMAMTTRVPTAAMVANGRLPMRAMKTDRSLRVCDEGLRAPGNAGARTFSCDLTAWSNARQRLSCLKSGENVTNNETP